MNVQGRAVLAAVSFLFCGISFEATAVEVGTTAGQFSVTPSGAASYSVPITVPPGTAGVKPELAVTYSSQSGNGLLGSGFELSGLSQITRCAPTLEQDGYSATVTYTSFDRFCLDGQRLVAVVGTYGDVGTEYRTEIETFSKIVSYSGALGDPGYFKVWTKAGEVIEYGATGDSRIEAQGKTQAMVWGQNKVSDSVGNYITFSYTENSTTGEFYPASIQYTGNTAAGLTPNAAVNFVYEARTDVNVAYLSGSKTTQSQRLSKVRTTVNASLVREYRLVYDQGGLAGGSRLISITECDAAALCMPATTMQWPTALAGDYNFTAAGSGTWSGPGTGSPNIYAGDYNGDGIQDLAYDNGGGVWKVCLSTGTSLPCSNWNSPGTGAPNVYAGDFNADGKTDIGAHMGGTTWNVCLSTGTNFSCSAWVGPGTGAPNVYTGDFNGDGRADVGYHNGGGNWVICSSTGSGFSCATVVGPGTGAPNVYPGDFNADGKTDLAYHNGGTSWRMCLSTGAGFNCSFWTGPGTGAPNVFADDFNGDGNTDIAYHNGGVNWQMCLSTGAGFSCSTWTGPGTGAPNVYVRDYNADGRADVAYHNGGTNWQVCLSTGQGFSCSTWTGTSTGAPNIYTGDYNGDGQVDLAVHMGGTSWQVAMGGVQRLQLLKGITNGLGAQIQIDYKPLTNASVYTKGAGSVYPVMESQAAMYVVSEQRSTDGLGGFRRVTYQYSGMRMHVRGRGNLGFARVITTDVTNGVIETSDYRQDFPYVGAQYQEITTLADGRTISDRTTTYADIVLGTGSAIRHFGYAQTDKAHAWEINLPNRIVTSTVTTNEYTETTQYGNLTRSTVQVYPGIETGGYVPFTTLNDNSYSNDAFQWRLGRLLTASVTRTNPDYTSATRNSTFVYDAGTGQLTSEWVEPMSSTLWRRTDYERDAYGNITKAKVTGASVTGTRTTISGYDARGQFALTTTNPLTHVQSRTFNATTGNVLTSTDPNGLVTTFQYDGFGRPTRVDRPDGTYTTTARAWCSGSCTPSSGVIKVTTTGSDGSQSIQVVDILERGVGQLKLAFDGRWARQLTEYDAKGRVTQKSVPHFPTDNPYWTTYDYDLIGRVIEEDAPLNQSVYSGRTTNFSYDGLITQQTDALSHITTQERNALGKMVKVTDHNGKIVTYEYDPYENLTKVTDPLGNNTVMGYDLRGRKISVNDPDMGLWTYGYDGLDELLLQIDAKSQMVTLSYDALGRRVQRTEPEGTTTWTYDSVWKGALTQVSAPNGYLRVQSYDALGRPQNINTTINSLTHLTVNTYDAQSRPASITYPSGVQVTYSYNGYGYLEKVFKTGLATPLWQRLSTDAFGHVTLFQQGGVTETTKAYDMARALPTAILTDPVPGGSGGSKQSLSYDWDAVGNLVEATDQLQSGLREEFEYDALNRMTRSRVYTGTSVLVADNSQTYNAIGNILTKTGVGTYTYGAKPHAVSQITGARTESYYYDNNGNQTSSSLRTFTWLSYNMPASMQKGIAVQQYQYGPDRERIRQVDQPLGLVGTIKDSSFVGEYERQDLSGTVQHKHYISAGGELVAIITRNAGVDTIVYAHNDHRGSLDVLTSATNTVIEGYSYDAFGKRRQLNWSDDTSDSLLAASHQTDKGFTGHQHLDDVALIHMGGRVYDPITGRFTSADPFVQFPENAQGFNRYAYVNNNPLSYTDPSGFMSKHLRQFIAVSTFGSTALLYDHGIRHSATFRGIAQAGAAAIDSTFFGGLPVASSFNAAYTTKRLGGGWGDAIRTGTINAGTSMALQFVPGDAYSIKNIVGHGVVGGLSSVAQGGKFGSGFAAGALQAAVPISNNPYIGIPQSAVVGGTASVITGGSFANGAMTASFRYLLVASISPQSAMDRQGSPSGSRLSDETVTRLISEVEADFPELPQDVNFTAIDSVPGDNSLGRTLNGRSVLLVRWGGEDFFKTTVFHELLHVDEMRHVAGGNPYLYRLHELFEHPFRHDPWINQETQNYGTYLGFSNTPKPAVNEAPWRRGEK